MSNSLEEEVLMSWGRCLKIGLTTELNSPRFFQKTNSKTIEKNLIINSIFEKNFSDVENCITNDCLFLLFDSSGILINAKKKPGHVLYQPSIFEVGNFFSEESCGTNAVSLAMKLKKVIYLASNQHYCKLLRNYFCYAIPIIINNQIIGYLDISSYKKPLNKEWMIIGNMFVDKLIYEYNINKHTSPKEEKEKLTLRHKTIIKLLMQGYTTKAVALETGLSENTVKYHKKTLFKKLNVNSLGEAITKVLIEELLN